MKIYDFIMGEAVSDNYIINKYTRRFELEDDGLSSLYQVAKVIYDELVKAWEDIQVLPYNIDTIMASFKMLVNSLKEGEENGYAKLREILSVLKYIGYEVYLIQRVDLFTTDYSPVTRAYLIDRNDNLFPTLNRVAAGYGMKFDVKAEASLPNVIMSFMNDVISFDEVTLDLISFKNTKEKFEALNKLNAGWQFDISKLQKFLLDYGYKFIVVTEGY